MLAVREAAEAEDTEEDEAEAREAEDCEAREAAEADEAERMEEEREEGAAVSAGGRRRGRVNVNPDEGRRPSTTTASHCHTESETPTHELLRKCSDAPPLP